MTRVIFIEDPFDFAKREVVETNDVFETLSKRWAKLPHTVGLFHEHVTPETNVTPHDEAGIEKLCALTGDIYAVQFPGDAVTAAVLIISVVFAVVAYNNTPSVPQANVSLGRPPSSANNDLSERVNKPRVNGRIPDIYGTDISVPDIVAAPYTVHIDNEAYEYSYLCVGRGEYEIDSAEVKDDTTPLAAVEGSSAAFYSPNTSPNNSAPFLLVGDPIDELVLSVAKTSAVNGQTLDAPNETAFNNFVKYLYPNKIVAAPGYGIDFTELFANGDSLILNGSFFNVGAGAGGGGTTRQDVDAELTVEADGTVSGVIFERFSGGSMVTVSGAGSTVLISMATQSISGASINLSGRYNVVSDTETGEIVLRDVDLFNETWALLPGSPTTITGITISSANGTFATPSLSGTYVATSVSAEEIELTDAGLTNNNWVYTYRSGGATAPSYPNAGSVVAATVALDTSDVSPAWIGPFDVYLPQMDGFIINLVAERGMFRDDGTAQSATSVECEIETTLLAADGSILSVPRYDRVTIVGSAFTQEKRSITYRPDYAILGASGVRGRVRRITERDNLFTGQVVDAVQWADFYATSSATPAHFGNVTTVHSRTRSTKGALSLKQRKLNARVTRKLPLIDAFGDLVDTPVATRDAASIIAAIALDEKLGNRTLAEIDLLNLRQTVDSVAAYFGREATTWFGYTFDNDNLSFQDMISAVAGAAFCTAYREGSVIKLFFEKLTDEASLIFCHRNKLPRSEKRTTVFGKNKNHDGVEYTWRNPADSASETLYFPPDRSAINPDKIDSIGVRNHYQAMLHGWRIYNRQRYQRTRVEFKATQEAELLLRNQRVLVSNNTRPHAQDGEVLEKNGLVLTLSQPVTFDPLVPEYFVFLQLKDGTTQSIACTEGPDKYSLTLAEEPSLELSLNPSNFALTTYVVVPAQFENTIAFLVDSRTYDGPFTSNVTCINYDPRYYTNDQDFNYRIATPVEDDAPETYDEATGPGERDPAAYVGEESDDYLIPASDGAPYVLAEDDEL